jgi:hypothetical protein
MKLALLRRFLFCFLVLGLVVTGCGTPTPMIGVQDDAAVSPLSQVSPLATATLIPTQAPVPSLTFAPSPMPSPTLSGPSRLVVLHTNDNWGETEPCG